MGRRSIARYIAVSVASVLIISLALLAVYSLYAVIEFNRLRILDDLETQAFLFIEPIRSLAANSNWNTVDKLCKELGAATNTRFTVIMPDGKVTGDSSEDPSRMTEHASRPEIIAAFATGIGRARRFSPTLRREYLYVAKRLDGDNGPLAVVRASMAMESARQIANTIRWKLSLAAILFLLIGALLGWIVTRRVSRDLNRVVDGSIRFAKGELGHRIEPPVFKENRHIVEAMNHMAIELEARIRTITEQRNELDTVWNNLSEGVIVLDNQHHVLRMNQSAANILHIDPLDARGRDILEVVRHYGLEQCVQRAISSNECVDGEVVLSSSGERYFQIKAISLHNTGNQTHGALLVLADITKLRLMENAHQTIIHTAAHELQQYGQEIQALLDTQSELKTCPALYSTAEKTKHLAEIIIDLLKKTGPETCSPDTTHQYPQVSAFSILEEAAAECREYAKQSNISLHIHCDKDLQAKCEKHLVRMAMICLIDNAIRYSMPGGTVDISAQYEHEELLLTVADNGQGIRPDQIDHLFDPYYSLDSIAPPHINRLRGLSIVKLVATAYGGRISVSATPHKGSTFTISFPCALTEDSQHP